MTTAIAIHQPEYFPWLGFLEKARRADVLVLLDNVQFDRSSLQHRTRIVGPNGPFWITIPFVHAFPQRIDEVRVADARWRGKHLKSIQGAYARTTGWRLMESKLTAMLDASYEKVVDAALRSIAVLCEAFEVRPRRVVRASELEARGEKGELVLAICKELDATTYIAGRTGATYLDAETFRRAGVRIDVCAFAVPDYRKAAPVDADLLRGVSALDAWAYAGAEAPLLLGRGDA